MMRKAGTAALCAFLSLAALSCGSGEPGPAESGTDPVSAPVSGTEAETEPSSLALNQLPEPELPAADYGGADYLIYSEVLDEGLFPADLFLASDGLTGEIVNDAVFNRNLKISETFNTKVTVLHSEMASSSLVLSGEPLDLVMNGGVALGYAVSTGAYLNFLDTPYVDPTQEYWYPNFVEGAIVDDRVYFLPSEACLDPLIHTEILYFNKRLMQDHDLEYPYDLVESGDWTIDEFLRLVKTVHGDLNGDGLMDEQDLYGALLKIQYCQGAFLELYFGCGGTFTKPDPEEGRVLAMNGEFCQSLLDKICDVFTDKAVVYEVQNYYTDDDMRPLFSGGHGLICQDTIGGMDFYREMEDDFGVLPFPKYDSEQQEYYNRVNPFVAMFAVPASAPDLEKTGMVAEYMSWLSHNTVLPAYYEITLQQKRTRDPRDVDMLEIIRKTLVFDFADIYDTHVPYYFWDSYVYRSFSLRVGASWKYLTKRNQKFVRMIRSLD